MRYFGKELIEMAQEIATVTFEQYIDEQEGVYKELVEVTARRYPDIFKLYEANYGLWCKKEFNRLPDKKSIDDFVKKVKRGDE